MRILFVLTNHFLNYLDSFVLQIVTPTECISSDGLFKMLILNYASHPSLTRNREKHRLQISLRFTFSFFFLKKKYLRRIIGVCVSVFVCCRVVVYVVQLTLEQHGFELSVFNYI